MPLILILFVDNRFFLIPSYSFILLLLCILPTTAKAEILSRVVAGLLPFVMGPAKDGSSIIMGVSNAYDVVAFNYIVVGSARVGKAWLSCP